MFERPQLNPRPAGDFRHRVQLIARDTSQRDELGAVVDATMPGSTAWASVRALSGRELINAGANSMSVSHEIRLRYTAELRHDSTIIYNGRRFDVVWINNVDERNRELVVLCNEITA